jgi:hypothetical protein
MAAVPAAEDAPLMSRHLELLAATIEVYPVRTTSALLIEEKSRSAASIPTDKTVP